jgi:hypothetical protein
MSDYQISIKTDFNRKFMANTQPAKLLTEARIPGLVEDESFQFDADLKFERSELNQLREIWREKSKAKGCATRADFDVRTLKAYLRNMLILDVVEQADGTRRYRYRYMGSSIVEVFGEQTHRFVDSFIPADKIARWRAGHDLIVLSGRALRLVVNYTAPQINYLGSEGIFFPLVDDKEQVTQIMGFNYMKPRRI